MPLPQSYVSYKLVPYYCLDAPCPNNGITCYLYIYSYPNNLKFEKIVSIINNYTIMNDNNFFLNIWISMNFNIMRTLFLELVFPLCCTKIK